MTLLAGIDIGGTTTDVLLVSENTTVALLATPTDVSSPARVAASAVAGLRAALAESNSDPTDLQAIGVCSPGSVDPDAGTVVNARNLGINGTPLHLASQLRAEFGVAVVVENDVNAAAMALYHELGPTAPTTLVYLNVGTGIAAAVLIEGQPLRGASGAAGELGQLHIAGGPTTIEDVAGGRAVASDSATATIPPEANAALADLCHAVFVAYDPEMVAIGGGVTLAPGFSEALFAAIADLRHRSDVAARFTDPDRITIVTPDRCLGPRGAVYLAQIERKEAKSREHRLQANRKETP